ncbi:MAG TPA: VOC family protein [Mycobacteriales bacterium]|nr:VOC family protein [Mycobacteriales bacterium]
MEASVHLVTLGVDDLGASRAFYVDGLGWQPVFEVPGAVIFIQIGHGLLLGLFGADDLDADVGGDPHAVGPPPLSLAQILPTEAEVVATLAAAESAGATILKPAQYADFGGFHGYFADPSGFRWEIATNPGWSVAEDGTVSIGPIGG